MLRKILVLVVVGLFLSSCGTNPVVPVTGTVKNVTATSGDEKVTVSWTFSGDTAKINGFKIVRDDGTGYKDLTTLNSKTARIYDDTAVVQGGSYKYGVAVIDSAGKVGAVLNQVGAGVGPNPVTPVGSLTGNWKMIRTNDDPANPPAVLTMSLDVTDTSGTLSGNAYIFSEGDPFGRGNLFGTIEGTNGSSGFTLKIVYIAPNEGFLELTGTISGSTFSGTAVDANDITGTFTGEKITE